jgi:uncharacterized protein YndB with AHSA1/START domain
MSFSATASTVIRASRTQVWDAVTRPELIKVYFFGTDLRTDWKVGSPLTFNGEWDGKTYEDRGTVLAFEPEQTLSFNYWSSFSGLEDKPELRQIVRYELEDAEGGVRVAIHQSNIDTQERADHSGKNWQMVLEGLKSMLEKPSGAA